MIRREFLKRSIAGVAAAVVAPVPIETGFKSFGEWVKYALDHSTPPSGGFCIDCSQFPKEVIDEAIRKLGTGNFHVVGVSQTFIFPKDDRIVNGDRWHARDIGFDAESGKVDIPEHDLGNSATARIYSNSDIG